MKIGGNKILCCVVCDIWDILGYTLILTLNFKSERSS